MKNKTWRALGKLLLIAKAVEALGYGACAAPAELDLRRGIWPTIYGKVVDIEGDYFAWYVAITNDFIGGHPWSERELHVSASGNVCERIQVGDIDRDVSQLRNVCLQGREIKARIDFDRFAETVYGGVAR